MNGGEFLFPFSLGSSELLGKIKETKRLVGEKMKEIADLPALDIFEMSNKAKRQATNTLVVNALAQIQANLEGRLNGLLDGNTPGPYFNNN